MDTPYIHTVYKRGRRLGKHACVHHGTSGTFDVCAANAT